MQHVSSMRRSIGGPSTVAPRFLPSESSVSILRLLADLQVIGSHTFPDSFPFPHKGSGLCRVRGYLCSEGSQLAKRSCPICCLRLAITASKASASRELPLERIGRCLRAVSLLRERGNLDVRLRFFPPFSFPFSPSFAFDVEAHRVPGHHCCASKHMQRA
jgi:hypothetical protein